MESRFLAELAGATSVESDSYARRNLSSLGAVLLIPAIVAVFGGFVFADYLGAPWWLATLIALLWGLVILVIDRHLVLTTPVWLPKVEGDADRVWSRPLRVLGHVGIRLLLALFLGTLNGHLVGLRLFDDVLSEELHDQLAAARIEVNSEFDGQREALLAPIAELERELGSERERLVELDATAAAELAGSTDLPGTTGIRGAGQVYERYERALDEARARVADRSQELNAMRADLDPQSIKLEEDRNAELAEVEATFATGVVARSRALVELSRRNPHVGLLFGFLLAMLVTIEVLPVVLKLLTPTTAADESNALGSWERQQEAGVRKEAVLSTHDIRLGAAQARIRAEHLADDAGG